MASRTRNGGFRVVVSFCFGFCLTKIIVANVAHVSNGQQTMIVCVIVGIILAYISSNA